MLSEGTFSVCVRYCTSSVLGLFRLDWPITHLFMYPYQGWCIGNACTHLNGFPVAPLYRVLHLITGVETWERGEGVDPGAA